MSNAAIYRDTGEIIPVTILGYIEEIECHTHINNSYPPDAWIKLIPGEKHETFDVYVLGHIRNSEVWRDYMDLLVGCEIRQNDAVCWLTGNDVGEEHCWGDILVLRTYINSTEIAQDYFDPSWVEFGYHGEIHMREHVDLSEWVRNLRI